MYLLLLKTLTHMAIRPFALSCCLLFLTQSCSLLGDMKTQNTDYPAFSYEGHRGARGLYPENSIGAMKTAIDIAKVTTLEMDCHVTKDNRVIVYHDHHLNPKFVQHTNGKALTEHEAKRAIYAYTYNELAKFDIGSKYYAAFPNQKKVSTPISLLSDLIEESEQYAKKRRSTPMYYNIETKSEADKDLSYHPKPQEFVDLIMNVVIEKGIASRTIIQSFDKRTLQYLNKIYPQIKASYLISEDNQQSVDEIIKELGFTPYLISPHYTLISKKFVSDAHSCDVKVVPWTVNEKDKITELMGLNVDGMISDYPNLF